MNGAQKDIHIRRCTLEDEDAVVEICHLTGNMQLDPYLFALRWCLDYVWHETEHCFVAEQTASNRVVGYILGAPDTTAQKERYQGEIVPRIEAHWQTKKQKTMKDFKQYFVLRASERHLFPGLLRDYPAHLHMNVHPDFQRRGIGRELMAAYEENLRQHGVPGYHLGVGAENALGINFYRKQGLEELDRFPPIGKPIVIAYGRRIAAKRGE